jgi:hypothetical protein
MHGFVMLKNYKNYNTLLCYIHNIHKRAAFGTEINSRPNIK